MARRSVSEVAAGAVVLVVAIGFLFYAIANTGRASLGGYTLHAAFDNIFFIDTGSYVIFSGFLVGSVTALSIDPKTYQAVASFTVQSDIKLSTDSSATIATGGLLGGNFVSLSPGGETKMLGDGGTITITQSAANLEDLLGKFIFNVGNLATAAQNQMDALKKTAPND